MSAVTGASSAFVSSTNREHAKQIEELHRDIADFARTGKEPPKTPDSREQQRERDRPRRPRTRARGRDFER
jgi:hypothetical protein